MRIPVVHGIGIVMSACFLVCGQGAAAGDWPQFRGPEGTGHSPARGLPLRWSETENVAWKVAIDGRGWSSPVVQGEQVWITTSRESGRSLRAVCVDRETGRLVHDVEVFGKPDPGRINAKNSHASPTPVLDGDRVYVHYGAHGTACLTTDGQIVWKTPAWEYDHRHGPGGSPILFEDLLLFSCDGTDVQFVVALDKRTGKVRWKRDRKGPMAYFTPAILALAGQPQLISPGGDQVVGYEPRTGRPIWHVTYDGYSGIARPVAGHGLVFICTGFDQPWLYAIRLGGRGNVTKSHVAWRMTRGAPKTPSPVLIGNELYVVNDKGFASCLDARTGKPHWSQKRLGGGFSASPVYADGRIYFLNERGVTTVLAPGTTFRKLATNRLNEQALASMAIAGKAIFLRTEEHLYRLEEGTGKAAE